MNAIFKNTLILVGLLLVAALGYFLYSQNASFLSSPKNDTVAAQVSAESEDFLRKLNELKQISLQDDLFTDPRFTNLRDFSTAVTPVSIGKANPFQASN